ncbi:TonB-dependent siderophore receptor [Bordetella genomosp. 12]|uniref:Secretin/TonB short N-terminal domain-containing protein n=1 Tax=Bordetella genomosp. 12 TaxID=463035 RepID=A0A261VCY2_9BORD|nr:TonB-dependent receptor [Bordetella genomosp. 12]OZI71412.1 hypothetical protein CAL22_16425 [Bordetella genomosp. 12]
MGKLPRHATTEALTPSGTLRFPALLTRARLIGIASIIAAAPILDVQAQPAAARTTLTVPAGDLERALTALGQQGGLMISYRTQDVGGQHSPGIDGVYTPEEALTALLSGTGLQAIRQDHGGYIIRRVQPGAPVAELETVTVTGTRAVHVTSEDTGSYAASGTSIFKGAKSLREIPQSVSVLTRQQLDDRDINSLEDALRVMPGISVSTYGGNPGNNGLIWSRGQQIDAYQYDGVVSSLSTSTGDGGGSQSDMAIYDRVELLRGPAGLLTGAGRPSGTVNLVRKRPRKEFGGSAAISAGSWDNYHSTVDVTGPLNEDGSLRGRAVLAGQDRNFSYSPAWNTNWTAYGVLEYDFTPHTTLGVSYTRSENRGNNWWTGQPTYSDGRFLDISRSKRIGVDWNRQANQNDEFSADLTHTFENEWVAKVTGRYAQRHSQYLETYPTSAVNPSNDMATWYARKGSGEDEAMGIDISLSGPFELFGARHDAVLGYSAERYEYDRSLRGATIGSRNVFDPAISRADALNRLSSLTATRSRYKADQSGWYGMTRFSLSDSVKLITGARISDYNAHSWSAANGWSKSPNEASGRVSPYGGIVFDVTNQVSLYTSYADIFRPNTNYGKDGVLAPRVGWQVETGAKGEFFDGRLNASLAVFQIREKNQPMLDATSTGCGPTAGSCYTSAGLTRSRGWEMEISGSPMPNLQLVASYTNSDAIILNAANKSTIGQRVQNELPKQTATFWAYYRLPEGPLAGLNLGLGARWQSKVWYGTSAEEAAGVAIRRQAPYVVVDALVGYQLTPRTEISLNVRNLFDKTYYSRLSYTSYYTTYGEPRSAMLTLRTRF